jgi:hypothetical protein
MRRAKLFAMAVSVLTLIGAVGVAHAETSGQAAAPSQPVHWDQKGRWSLRLETTQTPVGRDLQNRDMQAGAYYHLTPSLRVGGAVSFSNAPAQPDRTDLPQDQAPRVKLETSFKF